MEFLNKDAPIVDELGFAQQRDQSHKTEKDDTCSIPATRYWLSDTAARDASHHQICKAKHDGNLSLAAITFDHPQASPIVQRSIG
ncbi:hypothetical protein FOXG_20814 [Fusarium oxysporum f. sp. lycopersici 4287]|uniref:Uncharacterized protein n=1 Tax=Fusarium oxysporum f. sp. lycopersici (strain 4287 / CBS 123668 / FGSC 9935 / NRRL 34936) TaxID=426428 RepID=A0A0J9WS03_FUSO4|nr:hypothetical protein FOXG_20814 [Fusarium oxysporum f. sp. lycopersici 4287]KNB13432.1 hypothetical protein FOXG_20814 [Fusarium oxysporum f. sp. lycopersici 4287]